MSSANYVKITPLEAIPLAWDVGDMLATGETPDSPSVTLTRIVPVPELDVSSLLPGAPFVSGDTVTQIIDGSALALNGIYRASLVFSPNSYTSREVQTYIYVVNASPYTSSGVTLRELRQRCGSMLNDMILVEATADSDPSDLSSLVDMNTVTLPIGELKNRVIYFYGGQSENIGLQRVVTENFPGEGRVRWNIGLTLPVKSGDRAELWNHRAQGIRPSQMNEFLRIAHQEASVYSHVLMTITVADNFTSTEPSNTIAIPQGVSKVEGVQYLSSDQVWTPIPKAAPGGPGYWIEPYTRILTINRPISTWADGSIVRILARGREFQLEHDGDTTIVNAEWLCARACELACTALLNRNPDQNVYRDKMYKYERITQSMRTLIIPRTKVGTMLEW